MILLCVNSHNKRTDKEVKLKCLKSQGSTKIVSWGFFLRKQKNPLNTAELLILSARAQGHSHHTTQLSQHIWALWSLMACWARCFPSAQVTDICLYSQFHEPRSLGSGRRSSITSSQQNIQKQSIRGTVQWHWHSDSGQKGHTCKWSFVVNYKCLLCSGALKRKTRQMNHRPYLSWRNINLFSYWKGQYM